MKEKRTISTGRTYCEKTQEMVDVPLLGRGGRALRYTRAGAQRVADRWARESALRGAVGHVVAPPRGVWVISVGAGPTLRTSA